MPKTKGLAMATGQESRLSIVIDTASAEARIKELRKQLRELGGAADQAADDTGDLGNRADRASRDTNRLNASAASGKKALDGMAKAAALAGAALAGGLALSINKAQSWESSLAEINKTVEFATEDGLANMRKGLQELSTQIPQTFEELAAVTATGGQLGIAEENLIGFTETMAKMGVAFDIPAQQAADSMAKIANVFQIPIENISNLGDAINTLSNNTPATAAQLIDSLQRVGGVAKVFGLSADATLGLTGALIAMGKPAEVASTAVNSLLTSFSTLDNATKSQLIGFEQLGLDIDKFSDLVATDGKQAIITYLEAINELDKSQRIGTNALILGKEFGDDITMLAGSVGVLEKNWALLGETANTTKDYFGSMDAEFVKISETSANKMQLFKNNIDGVVAGVGEAFIPALNDLLLTLTPFIATMSIWVSENPELVQQIVTIGGSLAASVISIKLFADGINAAKTTIDGLKLAYTALASPMGLTIIALGALLAAGVLVYQNWDEIKQVVSENQGVFTALAVTVSALTVALIAANAPLIALRTLSAIAAVQAGVMTVATSAWSVAAGVAAAATWTFNAALAVLTSPILLVVAAIAGITAMGYLVVKNWSAISAGLRAEFERIKGAVMSAVNGMKAAWDRGVANTRAAFISIGNTISISLRALPAKMLQVGRDIVTGLINGIKSGASGVASAIGSMASSAISTAKSVLDIRSPSRKMKKVGEQTAEGMAVGIKTGAKAVKTEAQKMASSAIEAVDTGIARIKKEIALFGNNSNLADLEYDIGIGKYKGASEAQLNEYRAMVAELERLNMAAGATLAIQARFAQLQKATENSETAFNGLDINQPQSEAEKLRLAYQEKMAVVDEYERLHTDKKAQAEASRKQLTENYNQSIRDLELQKQSQTVGSIAAMFGMALGETSKGYKAMFAVQKAYDFVQAQSASFTAIAKAWASAPFPANLPAVATTTLSTGIIPAAIQALNPKGFKTGGYTGNMGVNQVAGAVHGQEYVFDAQSTKRIGVDNLNAMRSGKAANDDSKVSINIVNNSSAQVTASDDGQTITITDVRNEVKRGFTNLQNPNSYESKQINRNVQAPRRR